MGDWIDQFKDVFDPSDAKQVFVGCFGTVIGFYLFVPIAEIVPLPLWKNVLLWGIFAGIMLFDFKKLEFVTKLASFEHIVLALTLGFAFSFAIGWIAGVEPSRMLTVSLAGTIAGITADATFGPGEDK